MYRLQGSFTESHRRAIREQLDRLLADPLFSYSSRYPLFLRYVVEKTLALEADNLKERVIGCEVFEQPCDYDTNATPIVRFCASETRKRLALYYQEPEHKDELRIEMHPRSYVPSFLLPDSVESAPEVNPIRNTDDRERLGSHSSDRHLLTRCAGMLNSRRLQDNKTVSKISFWTPFVNFLRSAVIVIPVADGSKGWNTLKAGTPCMRLTHWSLNIGKFSLSCTMQDSAHFESLPQTELGENAVMAFRDVGSTNLSV